MRRGKTLFERQTTNYYNNVFFIRKLRGGLQLPDTGLFFLRQGWILPRSSTWEIKRMSVMTEQKSWQVCIGLTKVNMYVNYCMEVLTPTDRIISVHLTASWSSISLSLYWFLSMSTRAISTRVKRFRWAVGTSLWREALQNI